MRYDVNCGYACANRKKQNPGRTENNKETKDTEVSEPNKVLYKVGEGGVVPGDMDTTRELFRKIRRDVKASRSRETNTFQCTVTGHRSIPSGE